MTTRRKRKPQAVPSTPPTTSRSFRAPAAVIDAITRMGPEYGSRGRAIQVGTELLIRRRGRIKIPSELAGACTGAATYKLTPRTLRLLDTLAQQYLRHGYVLAACVAVLGTE